jgi:LysM repeat protein
MAITLLGFSTGRHVVSRVPTKLKDFNMSNPFGLPRVLMAEREARRRQQFRLGVYTVLIAATVLLMGMLIQGCRIQRQSSAETVAEKPAKVGNDIAANPSTHLPPVPEPDPESAAETNCVSPGSASLPDNITLPAPATASASHAITTHPSSPVKRSRKIAPPYNVTGVYVVKSSDTLTRIAKIHGTTVKALKTTNHLKSNRIFVGEKLKLTPTNLAMAAAAQN